MDQHMGQALPSWGRISLSLGHYWEGSMAQSTSPQPGSPTCCRNQGGRGGRGGSEGSLVVPHPLLEGASLGVELHGQGHVAVWLQGIETEHGSHLLDPREVLLLVLLRGHLPTEVGKKQCFRG